MKSKKEEKRLPRCVYLAVLFFVLAILCSSIVMAQPEGSSSVSLPLLQSVLPLTPAAWLTTAVLVVLTIIFIAVIVYMLAGLIDSPNARAWARSQIYEGILSIIFAIIFLAFAYFFFLNPQAAFQAVGLLPQATASTSAFNCSTAYDIFDLATCNIAIFNHFAFSLFEALYYVTIYLGYTPGISLTVGAHYENIQASASAGLPSLIPFDAETTLSFAFSGILLLFVLNQIQALLLAGSLMWLGFFVSLGLIARAFGFTRTFGGAMIAMGIGLGIIYPLVVNLTYGFINTTLSNSPDNTGGIIAVDLLGTLISIALYQGTSYVGNWVFPLGVAMAGLTFIPFLNFTIVDSFIVDFSRAIGERLDFLSLLVGII